MFYLTFYEDLQMAFTAGEIAELGYSSLNYYLRNKPIDQVELQRPLLKRLMAKKRSFPGGNDSIVCQLRKGYDDNTQWLQGSAEALYNTRETLDQSKFPWKGAHAGFQVSEDYLLSNGITLTDSQGPGTNSKAEMLQLTNLFSESMAVLRIGFEENLDMAVHTVAGATEELDGLETLIALNPAVGVVGGIDRATAGNEWWRNYAKTGVVEATMIENMEAAWRQCIIHGGVPDLIIAGAAFVDAFRKAAKGEISRYMVQNTVFTTPGEMDPSIRQANSATFTGLHFQGVPIVYDPTFELIDERDTPIDEWTKRCYFLNTNHLRLRPAAGHDMISRRPPRAYNYYVHRWAVTWKGGLTLDKAVAHAVLTL